MEPLSKEPLDTVIVDLRWVQFMGSSTLYELIKLRTACAAADTGFVVTDCSRIAVKVIEISG